MLAQTVLAQATKRHVMEFAALLTTWDRCTTGGRHVWLSQAAWSPLVSAASAAIGIGADADDTHVHALMVVRLTDALHPMLSLTPAEYEQSLFWSSVCGADIWRAGSAAYRFQVVSIFPCPPDSPHFSVQLAQRRKGVVISVKHGEADALHNAFPMHERPAWFPDHTSFIAIRVPAPHARLVAAQSWTSLILPDVRHGRAFTIPWDQIGIPRHTLPAVPAACLALPGEGDVRMDVPAALQAIDLLRRYALTLPAQDVLYPLVARSVHTLQVVADQLDPQQYRLSMIDARGRAHLEMAGRTAYKVLFMLNAFLFSDTLKQAHVVKPLLRALELAVPPSVRPTLTSLVSSQMSVHKSTVSRWRFLMDGALMLFTRALFTKQGKGQVVRMMMADSSDQRGRHFEFITVLEIQRAQLVQLFEAANTLTKLWRNNGAAMDDEEALTCDAKCRLMLQEGLVRARLPIMGLGSGLQTLRHKFLVTMYAFYLVCGSSFAALADYCQSIVVASSDLGVEFGLPRVQPIKARKLFPWISPTARTWAMDEAHEEAQLDDPDVSLERTLAVPGLLHMLHTIGETVIDSSLDLKEALGPLKDICKLISHETTCQRLRETCFSGAVGRTFHGELQGFNKFVYEKRWGTIAFAVGDILELMVPLVSFGDLARYTGQAAPPPEDADASDSGARVRVADAGLSSPLWWGRIMVMDALYSLLRKCIEWTESCPCPCHLDWSMAKPSTRKAWGECPLRGFRLPEVAAGELFALFGHVCQVTVGRLYTTLPSSLSAAERNACIQAFEAGRGAMLFVFTLNISVFTVPPLLVLAGAHPDREIAARALRTCRDSGDQHPLLLELRSPVLSEEVESLADGALMRDTPHLASFLAEVRFGYAGERLVEAGHAIVKTASAKAGRRAEAFDSLAVRQPDLRRAVETDVELFMQCLSEARNPRKLVRCLGLEKHPGCQTVERQSWSPLYRKIVYRSDPWSLYRLPLPEMRVGAAAPDAPEDADGPAHDAAATDGIAPPGAAAQQVVHQAFVVNLVGSLREEAARQHILSYVRQGADKPNMYSAKRSAIDSLHSMQSLAGAEMEPLAGLAGAAFLNNATAADTLWFSVVARRPALSKRALKGRLRNPDVGVAIHRPMGNEQRPDEVRVSTTAIGIEGVLQDEVPMHGTALVLSLDSLPWGVIQELREWDATIDLVFIMSGDFGATARSLLLRLLDAKAGCELPDVQEEEAELLSTWEQGALVERLETDTTTLWQLTERGQRATLAGTLLRNPRLVLAVMPATPAEMNRWQLMRSLELDGWQMKCVDTKRCLRDVMDQPYDPTHRDAPTKLWWIRPSTQDVAKINMDYLFLLLTGPAHEHLVPHLAKPETYKKLRNPDWKAKPNKGPGTDPVLSSWHWMTHGTTQTARSPWCRGPLKRPARRMAASCCRTSPCLSLGTTPAPPRTGAVSPKTPATRTQPATWGAVSPKTPATRTQPATWIHPILQARHRVLRHRGLRLHALHLHRLHLHLHLQPSPHVCG